MNYKQQKKYDSTSFQRITHYRGRAIKLFKTIFLIAISWRATEKAGQSSRGHMGAHVATMPIQCYRQATCIICIFFVQLFFYIMSMNRYHSLV